MPDAPISKQAVTNTITGRDAFLRVLSDEGVVKMFGNPGTTELPIMHALSSAPEMGYVLALQEAVVIAMADGYARASYKLVSCNVHVAPGLGNAIGSIYTSMMSGTLSSTTSWSVRIQAAIMGRMAFLLPEARTVPLNGTPPSISNVDMAGNG